MRILICNTFDDKGGAAKSSYRILKTLQQQGIEAEMLSVYKELEDKDIIVRSDFFYKFIKPLIPKIEALPKLFFLKNRKIPFSVSLLSYGYKNFIQQYNPDIAHLNYINMGMLSIRDIGDLDIPIVWTLHDSWAFMGGFHLPESLNKVREDSSYDSKRMYHFSKYILKKKLQYWKEADITLISPSNWLAQNAKKSNIFSNKRIEVIPNPIDTKVFNPVPKEIARKKIGLVSVKKYILFGAVNALEDKNKGFHLLREALKNLNLENIGIITFGSEDKGTDPNLPIIHLGYINNENDLANIYSAADLTVIPSISENLPNVMLESLSCGTPVVGFAVGGMTDIVVNKDLGYLAKPYNTKEFALCIEKALARKDFKQLAMNKYIEENYGYDVIGVRYKELYKSILGINN